VSSQPRAHPPSQRSGDVVRDSALGLVPTVLQHYLPLSRRLWLDGPLGPELLEMARLRNARKVNCVFCRSARYDIARAAGLTEDRIQQIEDGYQDSELSQREKLLLAFCDHYLDNPGGMDEGLKAALRDEFSPAELVHLSLSLLLFNTFSRCAVSLGGMPEELPLMEVSLPGEEGAV
jgi:alkylhydroperoxidase family enzyme